MKVLGIIPARGGSKGIPKKNIRSVNERPLVHYSIIRGEESSLITHLYLSTDSDEIIQACNGFVKLKIHERPPELAQDQSPTSDAVLHLLNKAEKENGLKYDYIIILQPTSPIRLKGEIDAVLNELHHSDCNSIISVCSSEDVNPARMYTVENEQLFPLDSALETKRRQELKPVYFRDGCFYGIRADAFREIQSVMIKPSKAFLRNDTFHLNIDSPRDLLIADILLKTYFEI